MQPVHSSLMLADIMLMSTPRTVFMFAGQSSRDPSMIEDAVRLAPRSNRAWLREASTVLGRNLVDHFRSDNPNIFATQRDIMLGVFLTNHLHLLALEASGTSADVSLGFSIGEYNHLVHIGALDFVEALRVVDALGAAADAGPDGAMAVVSSVGLSELRSVVQRANGFGTLEIGAYSAPHEYLLSGEVRAVEAALTILEAEQRVLGTVINARSPMHSKRFWRVVPRVLPWLQKVRWSPIRQPYLPNVAARFISRPTPGDLIYLLTLHLWRPVRWQQSIDFVHDRYPGANFLHVGHGAPASLTTTHMAA
jgi:[acyl-carrier-protein] S-malonyltransferase